MKFKYQQIADVFTKPLNELWFSGKRGEGEYREWYSDGTIWRIVFHKRGKRNGEAKVWDESGALYYHYLYKNDKIIKDYLK